MTRALLILLALVLLAGCGEDGTAGAAPPRPAPEAETAARAMATATPAPERAAKPRPRGRTIKVVDSQYGPILADGRGQALYFFDRETSERPRCYGECAEAWPPVLTEGRPVAGAGARKGKLGVTRRRDGSAQVTYAGRPLYYYVADRPGLVLCHDVEEFGGLWVVIRPDGTRVP